MALQKWKTLSSKVVFKHPRMTLTEDEVALPDGQTMTYLRDAPGSLDSVGVIAMDSQGRILLEQEYSYAPDEIMWQLPGGGMEKGESVMDAANRELSEEAGLMAEDFQVLGSFYLNNRRSAQKQHIVLCTGLSDRALPKDKGEFIETSWFTLEEIEDKIRAGEIVNICLLAGLNLYIHSL